MELINKEELINKINAYMVTTADVTMVRKLISELPVIESRPKGKWEKHKTKSGKNWWKCSQCGHVEMKRYPYCAICGSDMRGEE